ncbi:MAG TPA: MTAP family purine nucleoside phosphorylase [Tepidisphaeraceae bacterium]|jgi:5'-methylthioadenosine phosphorylase
MSEFRIGVIGGTGIGGLFGLETVAGINVIDTPFGPTSAPIAEVDWHGTRVFLLPRHGIGHVLNPSQVPYRANLFALKKLGVTHILASGAVGSLRQEYAPRDLVICDQLIDKTRRPGTFFDNAAVHVEFAEPFCPVLQKLLADAAEGGSAKAHAGGCYVAMEGPAFSTRAESHMHRLWGGDLIGMTAMPETKLAKEAEIAYALVALVTDYDSWKQAPPPAVDVAPEPPGTTAVLDEIIANIQAASANAVTLIKRAIELAVAEPARLADCPAHRALERAIWSDKSHISRIEVDRLAPLWLKYLRPPAAPDAG